MSSASVSLEDYPEPGQWVDWLLAEKRRALKTASWRLYKRCAVQVLLEWPDEHSSTEDALERLEGDDMSKTEGGYRKYSLKEANAKSTKTSAKRLRFFSPMDLFLFLSSCSEQTAYANYDADTWLDGDSPKLATADWLVAGLATALRPCEWRQSRLVYISPENNSVIGTDGKWRTIDPFWIMLTNRMEDVPKLMSDIWPWVKPREASPKVKDISGELWLVVYNAKHSNNRGNEATRAINLTDAPLAIKLSVLRMVIRGRYFMENVSWRAFYETCRKCLNWINQKLFPSRGAVVNLYSCRHQGLANIKAKSGMFNAAVLAGHGYEQSSALFYAGKAYSWGKMWEEALQACMAGHYDAIRELSENYVTEIDCQGKVVKRRRGRRRGGTIRPIVSIPHGDILAKVGAVIAGLAAMPTPGVFEAEAINLKLRDAMKAERYSAAVEARRGPGDGPRIDL